MCKTAKLTVAKIHFMLHLKVISKQIEDNPRKNQNPGKLSERKKSENIFAQSVGITTASRRL